MGSGVSEAEIASAAKTRPLFVLAKDCFHRQGSVIVAHELQDITEGLRGNQPSGKK